MSQHPQQSATDHSSEEEGHPSGTGHPPAGSQRPAGSRGGTRYPRRVRHTGQSRFDLGGRGQQSHTNPLGGPVPAGSQSHGAPAFGQPHNPYASPYAAPPTGQHGSQSTSLPIRPPTAGLGPRPEAGVAGLAQSVAGSRPFDSPPDRSYGGAGSYFGQRPSGRGGSSSTAAPGSIPRPGAPPVQNVAGNDPYYPEPGNPGATFSQMDLNYPTPAPQPPPQPRVPFFTDAQGNEIPAPHVNYSPTSSEERRAVGGGNTSTPRPGGVQSPAPSAYTDVPQPYYGGDNPDATFSNMDLPQGALGQPQPPRQRRRDSLRRQLGRYGGGQSGSGSGSQGPPPSQY